MEDVKLRLVRSDHVMIADQAADILRSSGISTLQLAQRAGLAVEGVRQILASDDNPRHTRDPRIYTVDSLLQVVGHRLAIVTGKPLDRETLSLQEEMSRMRAIALAAISERNSLTERLLQLEAEKRGYTWPPSE